MSSLESIQRLAARARIDRSLNYGRHAIAAFLRDLDTAGPAAPRTVVDLGAGHGDDLRLARQCWPSAALHAVEAMPFHADLLAAQGLAVHRLDIERHPLPFAPETVDVVIANQILEHTKELFWILHESARILRIGGAMIVGVPNLASLHNRLLLLLGRQPTSITIDSAHVRGFTRRGLARLLDRAAPGILRPQRHIGSNFYPFPPALARPLASLLPGMAVSSFHLIRKVGAYHRQILDFVEASRFETNYFTGHPSPHGHTTPLAATAEPKPARPSPAPAPLTHPS